MYSPKYTLKIPIQGKMSVYAMFLCLYIFVQLPSLFFSLDSWQHSVSLLASAVHHVSLRGRFVYACTMHLCGVPAVCTCAEYLQCVRVHHALPSSNTLLQTTTIRPNRVKSLCRPVWRHRWRQQQARRRWRPPRPLVATQRRPSSRPYSAPLELVSTCSHAWHTNVIIAWSRAVMHLCIHLVPIFVSNVHWLCMYTLCQPKASHCTFLQPQ